MLRGCWWGICVAKRVKYVLSRWLGFGILVFSKRGLNVEILLLRMVVWRANIRSVRVVVPAVQEKRINIE